MEDDFGIVLGVLLGAIIITSFVWLVVGIRQLVSSWNKRYGDYIREKQERVELLYHNIAKIQPILLPINDI